MRRQRLSNKRRNVRLWPLADIQFCSAHVCTSGLISALKKGASSKCWRRFTSKTDKEWFYVSYRVRAIDRRPLRSQGKGVSIPRESNGVAIAAYHAGAHCRDLASHLRRRSRQ